MSNVNKDIVEIKTCLSELKDDVSAIRVTQEKQETVLRKHVKRTDVLEEKVVPLAEDRKFKEKLWEWSGRLWAAVAATAGTALGVYEAYQYVVGK